MFGAAILDAADATSIVTGVTAMITDHLPFLIGLLVFGAGLKWVTNKTNKAAKGRI